MRQTLRLLASVKPVRYLEPGTPTGIAGLRTHHSPHSSLRLLYHTTLEKLQAVPEHSLYRQSVEATTKHRLALVEGVQPAGWATWREKTEEILRQHPRHFDGPGPRRGAHAYLVERNGQRLIVQPPPLSTKMDPREREWDGEMTPALAKLTPSERANHFQTAQMVKEMFKEHQGGDESMKVELDPEPQLTAEQIEELEQKIGGGLIEEVIQVAEGELKLVDIMVRSQVWESLEEKPAEGQWVYFERKSP